MSCFSPISSQLSAKVNVTWSSELALNFWSCPSDSLPASRLICPSNCPTGISTDKRTDTASDNGHIKGLYGELSVGLSGGQFARKHDIRVYSYALCLQYDQREVDQPHNEASAKIGFSRVGATNSVQPDTPRMFAGLAMLVLKIHIPFYWL